MIVKAQIVICPNCQDLVTWSRCSFEKALHYVMYHDDIDRGYEINEEVDVVTQRYDCLLCNDRGMWDCNFVDGGKDERALNSKYSS